MRTISLALLLALGACGGEDSVSNRPEPVPGVGGPEAGTRTAPIPTLPTVAIAATGPGGCQARWDGQPVTSEQIADRGFAMVMAAVDQAGGARNMTPEMIPVLTVEAPADLGFGCAGTVLAAVQRSGMASVRLRPAGGPGPVLADFPLGENLPPPPVPMELGVGAGGRLTWNGAPIEPDTLAARLDGMGGGGAVALPPGGLDFRPAREATFGQVHDVLRMLRRRQLRPFLLLPAAPAGPPAPIPPPRD